MTATKDRAGEAKSKENAVESHWKQTRGVAAGVAEIKDWISAGDAIVALLREHEDGYVQAVGAKDADLATAYKVIIDTDVAAFRYVNWHVFYYYNLLKLRSRVDSLVNSLDKDKRNFSGRHEAEERIRSLKQLIDFVPKDSPGQLAKLSTGVSYKFHAGQATERSIRVTSAADKTKVAALDSEIAAVQKLDLTVQVILENTNEFLHTAFKEGLREAGEAVKEYFEVRRGIIDTDEGPDSSDAEGPGSDSGGSSGSGGAPGGGGGPGSDREGSGSSSGGGSATEEKKEQDKGKGEDKKKEGDKGGGAGGRYEVRFQMQAGKKELVPSVKITQTQSITVDQGTKGVDELMGRATKTWKNACQDAAAKMKKLLRGYPPNGVECPPTCGHVSDKMCDRDVEEGKKRLRIDFNNDAGHNFKS